MNQKFPVNQPSNLPAPFIVDNGIVVQKSDMLRLLKGLRRVQYIHQQDGHITSTGEGCVMEVFADPMQATIVANRSLYLNVHSFDYLEIVTNEQSTGKPDTGESGKETTTFALVQDGRCLCLTPLQSADEVPAAGQLDAAALEAIVTEALSASWDASLDDERNLP